MIAIRGRWITALVLLYAVLTAAAADRSVTSAVLPATQRFAVTLIAKDGRPVYAYIKSIAVDPSTGLLRITDRGGDYDLSCRLDRQLNLVQSDLVFKNEEDIRRQQYNQRVIKRLSPGRLLLKVALDGKDLYRKEIACGPETMEIELLPLKMQARRLCGLKGFAGTILDLNNGQKFNARLQEMSRAGALKMAGCPNYPQQIREIVADALAYEVYLLEIIGLTRIFLPSRFYLVLARRPPHAPVAYWSEQPGGAVFQIYRKDDPAATGGGLPGALAIARSTSPCGRRGVTAQATRS